MSENQKDVHRVGEVQLDMGQLADGLTKQLSSLGTLLRLAAVGSTAAGATLAAYVAFVSKP